MSNLEQLAARDNSISDISAIGTLTNLWGLGLTNNQIDDISQVMFPVSLTLLELSYNANLSDIGALSELTNLTVLDLRDCDIKDISALEDLTNLQDLNLNGNNYGSTVPLDLHPLRNMTELRTLSLGANSITDISALSALTKLTFLRIDFNSISNIDALSDMTDMSWLQLRINQISDISSLSQMDKLEFFQLEDNPLNREAYCAYIPLIIENNPALWWFSYDTAPPDLVCTVTVTIDVKPGSYPNSINLKSKGVVPVAVLTTEQFDATSVDPESIDFTGAGQVHWAYEDVDGDGDEDMILHFRTQDLDLNGSSTEATLMGDTVDGQSIEGTDTVNVVPKKKK